MSPKFNLGINPWFDCGKVCRDCSNVKILFIQLILFWIDELIQFYSIYMSSMNIVSIYDMKIAVDIFKCIFFKGNVWILVTISMKFVPKGSIDD